MRVVVWLCFFLTVANAYGQSCDCPAATACSTCIGGITTLTLRFNGSAAQTITADDQQGTVFSQIVNPNATFSFIGSLPNDKFVGSDVNLSVNGVANAAIPSNCGSAAVGNVYGSFTIVAATSKNGGPLCCSAALVETTPPVITGCPSNITVNLTSPACQIAPGWTLPTATDNCTLASFTSTHAPTDLLNIGTTTVTYTAVDSYNNSSSCSFTITVVDNTKPVFTNCLNNIAANAGNSCEAVVSWTPPGFTDNCSATLTSSHSPGSTFPIGSTTVTYTATDPSGNSSICSFNITVASSASPTVTGCPVDITLHTFEDAVPATWNAPQATASCGQLTSTASHEPGTLFNVGVTDITYDFTDAATNKSSCTFKITVIKDEVKFEASKAVTPNGDGVNDSWQIQNIEKFKDNTVLVVDRWGNKVYQSGSYDNATVLWNGVGVNGNKVPTGTYFYTIEVRVNGELVRDSGFIEVIY